MTGKVCVVGLGYIGLPTAAMLASRGYEVVGCDVNERAVTAINNGRAHFQEPDLQMLLAASVQTGRLPGRRPNRVKRTISFWRFRRRSKTTKSPI